VRPLIPRGDTHFAQEARGAPRLPPCWWRRGGAKSPAGPLWVCAAKTASFGFFVDFFVKTVRHDFLQNVFCCVFELPSLRNTRKRDKAKKKSRGKTDIEIFVDFLWIFFRHGLFAKIFLWRF
jgi:hypothetical protein